MPTARRQRLSSRRRSGGAVIVEVALSASLFLLLMLAIVEFARYMLTWNAASEATRIAARMYAGGCSTAAIEGSDKVRSWAEAGGYPVPQNGWLDFQLTSCGAGCELARVGIKQAPAGQACSKAVLVGRLMLPGLPGLECLPIPAFTQTATREAGGVCN